jgi:MarR family transcriptional regulator, transcriptional regulator for hemolysin
MNEISISVRTAAARGNRDVTVQLEPEFGALIREISRLMQRNFEQHAREAKLPLTRVQASALLRIARQQGISQVHLAVALDVQPIAVVEIVDKLQKMRLIERRKSRGDRRVHELWLKPMAKPMLEQILVVVRGIRKVAFARFSSNQREAFLAELARVKQNLSWLTEEDEAKARRLAQAPDPGKRQGLRWWPAMT